MSTDLHCEYGDEVGESVGDVRQHHLFVRVTPDAHVDRTRLEHGRGSAHKHVA